MFVTLIKIQKAEAFENESYREPKWLDSEDSKAFSQESTEHFKNHH